MKRLLKQTWRQILFIAFVAVWMLVIFSFTSQSGYESNSVSIKIATYIQAHIPDGLSNALVSLTQTFFPEQNSSDPVKNINYLFRKMCHMSEYAFLAILLMFCFPRINKKTILITLLICLIYAIIDESHQLLVEGRTGKVKDIIVDEIGAIVGVALYLVFIHHFRKHHLKKYDH
jgi:VanZ family protein